MKFILVKTRNISPALFERHSVWVEYYEPDNIEDMIKDGFDKEEILAALEKTGYSDGYIFPVLNNIHLYRYIYVYYKAKIKFPNNTFLPGYLFLHTANYLLSIGIFVNERGYIINLAHPDLTKKNEQELCEILKIASIWPMHVISGYKDFHCDQKGDRIIAI
jgi:hypothetical protein